MLAFIPSSVSFGPSSVVLIVDALAISLVYMLDEKEMIGSVSRGYPNELRVQ
jgi:hypothetical protein